MGQDEKARKKNENEAKCVTIVLLTKTFARQNNDFRCLFFLLSLCFQ